MRCLRAALLAVALAAACAVPVTAAPPPPVEVTANAESKGIAAHLTLRAPRGWQPGLPVNADILLTVPDGARVAPPALEATLGVWDVSDVRVDRGADPTHVAVHFTLTAWESGALPVPAIPLVVELADASRVELSVGPVEANIESLVAEKQDLTELAAPARGPVDISQNRWLWYATAAVAALVCMWLARWMFWGRHPAQEPPPLPAHVWALREFDRLESERLPHKGEVDGFFARLSDIVRHYVEQRWGIHAPEQTTKEFLRTARHHPELSGAHETSLGSFLRSADMVKFAAMRPGNTECDTAMRAMRGFVEESAPAEQDKDDELPPPLAPEGA